MDRLNAINEDALDVVCYMVIHAYVKGFKEEILEVSLLLLKMIKDRHIANKTFIDNVNYL